MIRHELGGDGSQKGGQMDDLAKAPVPRDQGVPFATTLEERIPEGHPVRLFCEALFSQDSSRWERRYGLRSKIDAHLGVRRRQRQIMPGRWRRRAWVVGVLLVAVAAGVSRRGSVRPTSTASDYERYHRKVFRVARVVDGDTVDLGVGDGRRPHTRVRLWGVDTPEVAASDRGEMYYGPEATAFTKAALTGREVEVLLVKAKTRGLYGRLLAYLRIPGEEVTFNERLVETGHAYADWRFDHPYKERFLNVERRARRGRRGLWAAVRPEQMPPWRQRMAQKSKSGHATSTPNENHRPTTAVGTR